MKEGDKMKKRLIKLIAGCLLATIAITGCSKPAEKTSQTSGTPKTTETTPAPVKNEKLVVYTNSNSDGRGDWWIAKAKEAGFDIEIVGAGGAALANRLIAEKNNPVGDVVFGLNSMLYETVKKQNVLQKYVPAWASEIEAGLNDKEGYYHALVRQAILLSYNTGVYNEQTAPKDWTDLWKKPEYKGLYETPTLLAQVTPRIVVAGILTRYKDANGDLGISKEGWDEIKKFYNNGTAAVDGQDFFANMASKKTPIGTAVSGVLKAKEGQYNIKVGIAKPEVGVPMIVEQVAILNGTKKLDTAKRFVDWFGSAEIQGQFAEKFNAMPANTKSIAKASAAVKELYASIKVQNIDWGFVATNIDKWAEKIELQILK
ncbi:MAG: transporter substrate-binding protein [Clostridiales bacterium]|nr:transporter substrate-binding protein [Clostridiales bacterium]